MRHFHGSWTEKVPLLRKRSPAWQKPKRQDRETEDQPNGLKKCQ